MTNLIRIARLVSAWLQRLRRVEVTCGAEPFALVPNAVWEIGNVRLPGRSKPAKARQKDRDARWTVKHTKAKVKEGAAPGAPKPVDLAIPMFGCKNHVGIDRAHGLIRTWQISAANAHDGARLPELVRAGSGTRESGPFTASRPMLGQMSIRHWSRKCP